MTTAGRIVVAYAVWAFLCAALAGVVTTLVDGGGSLLTAVGIAAGQGLLALITGGLLARLGRALQLTLLLGLLLGLLDVGLYLVQQAVPGAALGFEQELAVLAAVAVVVTVIGSKKEAGGF